MALVAVLTLSVNATSQIASLTVKNIDEHYLYASSPAWKAIKDGVLRAAAPDRYALYTVIRRRLAELHDSELHLVAPAELAEIQSESEGIVTGTGLMEFSVDDVPTTGQARIVTPIIGSSAADAGLLPKDIIVSVNGRRTRDLDHEEALDELRAAKNADLLINRVTRSFRVNISPARLRIRPVVAKTLSVHGDVIAYMRVLQFTREAAASVRSAINNFELQHPRGYVLDLRNNPGGFLDVSAQMCGLFVSGNLGALVRAKRERGADYRQVSPAYSCTPCRARE